MSKDIVRLCNVCGISGHKDDKICWMCGRSDSILVKANGGNLEDSESHGKVK